MLHFKRILSFLLVLTMLVGMVPSVTVRADETEAAKETIAVETTEMETTVAETAATETVAPETSETETTEAVAETTEAVQEEADPEETEVEETISITEETPYLVTNSALTEYTEDEINELLSSASYPDQERPYWIIFQEGYRNDRVEMSVFDIADGDDTPYIVWNRGLQLNDRSRFSGCDQYYIENSCWTLFVEDYDVLSDYSTDVIASNLDVYDRTGNLICAATDYPSPGYKRNDPEEVTELVAKGEFNNHKYEVYDLSVTWTEAKAYCEELGGHLVTITAAEEQAFIESILPEPYTKEHYWIGATCESGEWTWVTNETFEYSNWNRNQPDHFCYNGLYEEYALIHNCTTNYAYHAVQYTWNDMFDDVSLHSDRNLLVNTIGFICEYDSEVELTGWQKAYYDYIVQDKAQNSHALIGTWEDSVDYEFVFLNGDSIPDLYITYQAGHALYSRGSIAIIYSDNQLTTLNFGGAWLRYENNNIIDAYHMGGGYWSDVIYQLVDSNTRQLAYGIKSYLDGNGAMTGTLTCRWDHLEVSEEGYDQQLANWINVDTASMTGSEDSILYDYDGILECLTILPEYRIEVSPEKLEIRSGGQGTLTVALYCNDQLVMGWTPPLYLGNNLVQVDSYHNEEGKFCVVFKAGLIKDASIVIKYNDDTTVTVPVTIVSDVDINDANQLRWINEHIEYANSPEYQTEIVPGYRGRMNAVFQDTLDDFGIKTYNFTKEVADFLNANIENISEQDLYQLLLVELMYNSISHDSMTEVYDGNLQKAVSTELQRMEDYFLNSAAFGELPSKLLDEISYLKKLDIHSAEFSKKHIDFIELAGQTVGWDKLAKGITEGFLGLGLDITLDAANITAKTAAQYLQYLYNASAYSMTSDDFKIVLHALRDKVVCEFGPESFPALEGKLQVVNWNEFASAIDSFTKSMDDYKEDGMEAMKSASFALIANGVEVFAKNSVKRMAVLAFSTVISFIPVVRTYAALKAALCVGISIVEELTNVDERSYCMDMLTKLYCLSVALDSVADDFAKSLSSDCYWTSTAFDEAIMLYKASQEMANMYMQKYVNAKLENAYEEFAFYKEQHQKNSLWENPHVISELAAEIDIYRVGLLTLQSNLSDIQNILCHSWFFEFQHIIDERIEVYDNSDIIIVACPTELTITDENGNQVAYLSNDTCIVREGHELYYHTIPLSESESMKIAVVPDTYELVLQGTASGEMDVFTTRFSEEGKSVNTYLDIPIEEGSTGQIENTINDSDSSELIVDGITYTPVVAEESTCGNDLTWVIDNSGKLIISGTGDMYNFGFEDSPWYEYRDMIKEIVLSEGITSIGDWAFAGLDHINEVSIPEGVTEIGWGAFRIRKLKNVELPNSLSVIGESAFYFTDLEFVTIPAGVTEIGAGAFCYSRSLKAIFVDPDNDSFTSDEKGVLYSKDMTILYQCPSGYAGEYVIADGTTTLRSKAFDGCSSLTKITIPDSVSQMEGECTFQSCASLKELILPNGITDITSGMAIGCNSLENVKLPDYLITLENIAFYRCTSLTRIIIPETVTDINHNCFKDSGLNTVIFCGSAPDIYETAFDGVTATAYYPGNDNTWTADVMLDYGGDITWKPYYGTENVTRIEAEKLVLNADESVNLTAILDPGVVVAEDIIWTLEDNGDGGGTTLTGNGLNAVLTAGWYIYDNVITITAQTLTGTADPAVLEITVRGRPADYTLFSGKSMTLKEIDYETGKYYSSKRLTWATHDEYAPYVTLTTTGRLTAKTVVSKTRILIFCDIDGQPGFMRVVDVLPAVTHVEVLDTSNGMIVNGKTIPIDFTAADQVFHVYAHPLDTMQNITWTISDGKKQAFAEYEVDGNSLTVTNIKGIKAGTVTVTATVDAGQKKSVSFKLQFGSFAKDVRITAAADQMRSGDSLQLSAVTIPAKPTKGGITWSLRDADKAYASISSSGLLKAKTVYDRTVVTVIATSKDGQAKAEYPVTILPDSEKLLILKHGEENVTKGTVYVDMNGSGTITLTAEYFDGLSHPDVIWTVPKSVQILEKTANTITIQFLKPGTVSITATNADKQKATVKVIAAQMAQNVEISQKKTNLTDGLEVASGKTLDLQATVVNAKSKKVIWSLAPGGEAFAKISSSGKLTANKDLTAKRQITVIAMAADGSGVYDEMVVTIRPIAQGVQIHSVVDGTQVFSVRSNSNWRVFSNTVYEWDMVATPNLTLSSHVYPYYGENHNRNAIQGVTWQSSSPKIASIDENGNVVCHRSGTTTITATAVDGSGKRVSFKLVVVKKTTKLELPDQGVVGGKTLDLSKLVQYSPTDVTNKNLNWEIIGGTGTAYATLNSKGSLKTKKVTAPVTVMVRVTATDGTPYTDTCIVTILPS